MSRPPPARVAPIVVGDTQWGLFSIRYRHHNHFSPDDVDLYSNVISVNLAAGQRKPSPP